MSANPSPQTPYLANAFFFYTLEPGFRVHSTHQTPNLMHLMLSKEISQHEGPNKARGPCRQQTTGKLGMLPHNPASALRVVLACFFSPFWQSTLGCLAQHSRHNWSSCFLSIFPWLLSSILWSNSILGIMYLGSTVFNKSTTFKTSCGLASGVGTR